MLLSYLEFLLPKNQFVSRVLDCNHAYPHRSRAAKSVFADSCNDQAGSTMFPLKWWQLRHRDAAARPGKAFRTLDACPGEVPMPWGMTSSHATIFSQERNWGERAWKETVCSDLDNEGQTFKAFWGMYPVPTIQWPREAKHTLTPHSAEVFTSAPSSFVTPACNDQNKGLQAPWWTWWGSLSELIGFFLLLVVKAA